MKQLTKTALRVFGVLEEFRQESGDVLDALMPFFEPLLADFSGQVFDAAEFAKRLADAYRWNVTPDVVEEILPRFEARKWVRTIAVNHSAQAFQVTYQRPDPIGIDASGQPIEQRLLDLGESFADFVREIQPLTAVAYSPVELADMLVEWLISIDAYSVDVLRSRAVQATRDGETLGLAVELPDASALKSEQNYLCARFVKSLFDSKSEVTATLSRIAAVGLLSEVIQDFQKPVTRVDRTTLIAFLDAPVALDLLGVSGKAAAANIRPIIAKLQEIGGLVRVFRTSLDEAKRALEAVLRRGGSERTGPTADAMRRGEVLEAYVRQIAMSPEDALRALGVQVVDRRIDQFPNEHAYFSQEEYDDFFSTISWHVDVHPREHDAFVVAQIMRQRRGHYTRDIFQSRFVAVTRNGLYAQSSKSFCRRREILPEDGSPPVVHQRQLATAIWLRTGLGNVDNEVPRRHVLAACERVLSVKRNVVDRVRRIAQELNAETAQQLELLLSQDRSTQVLMDRTLGTSEVISASNVAGLVDAMREGIAADVRKEARAQIADVKKSARGEIEAVKGKLRHEVETTAELKSNLTEVASEDRAIVEALLSEVNVRVGRRLRIVKIAVAVVVASILGLPALTEYVVGWWKLAPLFVSGAVGAWLAFPQMLDRKMGLVGRLDDYARAELNRLAIERGLSMKLVRFNVEYSEQVFRLAAVPISLGNVGGPGLGLLEPPSNGTRA